MSLNNSVRSTPLPGTDGWPADQGMPARRPVVERAIAAILSVLTRRERPPDVPDHLRADVGLPPIERVNWVNQPVDPDLPSPLKLDRW